MVLALATILSLGLAAALPEQDSLLVELQRNWEGQQTRLKKEIYSYRSAAVIRQLEKDGSVQRADTVITWRLQRGDSLLQDSTIYTTRRSEKEGKSVGRQRGTLPRLGDTSYVFESLPGHAIEFRPRRPGKGDLAGRVGYDPVSKALTWAEFRMPRPKAPVKEFSMRIDWREWEGMMVPDKMRMRIAWSMLVISGRMEMEIEFSDYRLHR